MRKLLTRLVREKRSAPSVARVCTGYAWSMPGLGTSKNLAQSNYAVALADGLIANGKGFTVVCPDYAKDFSMPPKMELCVLPDESPDYFKICLSGSRVECIILSLSPWHTFRERVKIARANADFLIFYSGQTLGEKLAEHKIQQTVATIKEQIDGVIVMTEMIREYWIDKGLLPERICNVGPLVRTELWKNVYPDVLPDTAMYFGNLVHPEVWDLLDVAEQVRESISSFRLIMYGDAGADQIAVLNDEVSGRGLTDCVEVKTSVPVEEMIRLQKSATVLLMPSRKWERADMGFPNKLGEYLMSDRPVIASRVDGVSCYINNGEHALFVQPGNIADFAATVIEVLLNPNAYHEMTSRAKDRIEEIADCRVNAQKMLRWIDSLDVSRSNC